MKAGTSPTPGLLKPHEGTFGIPSGNSNCAKGFPNKKVFAEIVFATDFGGRDYHTKASYSLLKLETLLVSFYPRFVMGALRSWAMGVEWFS